MQEPTWPCSEAWLLWEHLEPACGCCVGTEFHLSICWGTSSLGAAPRLADMCQATSMLPSQPRGFALVTGSRYEWNGLFHTVNTGRAGHRHVLTAGTGRHRDFTGASAFYNWGLASCPPTLSLHGDPGRRATKPTPISGRRATAPHSHPCTVTQDIGLLDPTHPCSDYCTCSE